MALLGAHVSTSGGVDKAPKRGIDLGCETIQIFTHNQMQWNIKPFTSEEIKKYHHVWKDIAHQFPVIAHDSYLINLGSPEKEKLEKSRHSFTDELDRAEQLGISFLVFHPGSHLNQISESECIKTIAESLNLVMEKRPDYRVNVLIENTAGQGSNIGYRFEHLSEILKLSKYSERLGICFDTCHALASGYDIRTEEGYEKVMAEFDRLIGLQWIKAFHLNDSKKPLGSRVDRHEHIGQGYVGLETFKLLVNDKRFSKTPMVLETPGEDEHFRNNLDILKGLRLVKS